jgi:hypothetical protein
VQIFWLACDLVYSVDAMEAVELFALLSRVDLALWKETARAVWPYACEWAAISSRARHFASVSTCRWNPWRRAWLQSASRRPSNYERRLQDHLRAADVEWMKEIVTAQNLLTLLFPEEATSEWPRVAVASQVFLYDPHERHCAMPQVTWVEPTACMCQVLGESLSGYLAVLVPGWGKEWIREETAPVSACSASEFRLPIRIVFRFMQTETMDEVLALLRLIGHDLKHLRIEDCRCPITPLDEFIEKVIFACPNLEELELSHMDLTNFQFIIDAINANRFPAFQNLSLFALSVVIVMPSNGFWTSSRTPVVEWRSSCDRCTYLRSAASVPVPQYRRLRFACCPPTLGSAMCRSASPDFLISRQTCSRDSSHTTCRPCPSRFRYAPFSRSGGVVVSAQGAGGDHAMERFDSHICSQIVSLPSHSTRRVFRLIEQGLTQMEPPQMA